MLDSLQTIVPLAHCYVHSLLGAPLPVHSLSSFLLCFWDEAWELIQESSPWVALSLALMPFLCTSFISWASLHHSTHCTTLCLWMCLFLVYPNFEALEYRDCILYYIASPPLSSVWWTIDILRLFWNELMSVWLTGWIVGWDKIWALFQWVVVDAKRYAICHNTWQL